MSENKVLEKMDVPDEIIFLLKYLIIIKQYNILLMYVTCTILFCALILACQLSTNLHWALNNECQYYVVWRTVGGFFKIKKRYCYILEEYLFKRELVKIVSVKINSLTLYPAHSRVGRGNLVVRHSVPHFAEFWRYCVLS